MTPKSEYAGMMQYNQTCVACAEGENRLVLPLNGNATE